jgi:hypothetical protein
MQKVVLKLQLDYLKEGEELMLPMGKGNGEWFFLFNRFPLLSMRSDTP